MSNGKPKALPLVSHTAADSIVAWSKTGPVTLQQFLNDVSFVAAQLFPGRHILNACTDRYHFSVGLAAAITTGRVSLLPATHNSNMAIQLKAYASDTFCLTDSECTLDLPKLQYPTKQTLANKKLDVPTVDENQLIATVFTSGSTGVPLPHNKTWGALVQCVQAAAKRVGLTDDHISPTTIIGTVPPQHMYGLESTVLMAWQSGHVLSHAHPFFPADICQAIADVPKPRILVSTPIHLRALVDSTLAIPDTACVLSATATLSHQLALDTEKHCEAPLIEIYGSTETGEIASRQPTRSQKWHLFDGIYLKEKADHIVAEGGHIATATKINDKIEFLSAEYFNLHGRLSDMINIAGKRHSLDSLNHQLNSIPGVLDGVFFMPDESNHTQITRLVAFVVNAPEISAKQILASLRTYLDPVFIPRPIYLVEKLPRNSTGKLPRPMLEALYNKLMQNEVVN